MATRLEIAKSKLERLEKDCNETQQSAYAHMALTNGQPMNDKRNGTIFFKRRDQLENKIFNYLHEIESQKERIKELEHEEYLKSNHLTANYGLQNSVYNIDKFKERKQDKKTRQKVDALEAIIKKAKEDSKIMSDAAKNLVQSGKVSRWEKQPIYYFVVGLRKVALVVENKSGNFIESKKYPAMSDEDKSFVRNILEEK